MAESADAEDLKSSARKSLWVQVPLGADMHTHIDPIEEARAMVGDDRVLMVNLDEPRDSCI